MVGDSVSRTELIIPGPAEALAALIGSDPADMSTIPPLWHWVYLLDKVPQRDLGPDGHPRVGLPSPPAPGSRRMFAGGRVRVIAPLVFNRSATRSSQITKIEEKIGSSGRLTFVSLHHEITQNDQVSIIEENDIVYRQTDSMTSRGSAEASPSLLSTTGPSLTLEVNEAFLFRFSALTYNAHRIHYDRDWARSEGYSDLVVHGPLQALMMAELFRRDGVSLIGQVFSYRLVAPMIGPQVLAVSAMSTDLAAGIVVLDHQGRVTARGAIENDDSLDRLVE